MVTRTAVIARQLLLVILACLGVTQTGINLLLLTRVLTVPGWPSW
jgi:hypothetical protein